MLIAAWAPLLLVRAAHVAANTEKTIFKAPAAITIPDVHPGLDDLCLDTLSPSASPLRTKLSVSFPSEEQPRGTESWFLLNGLVPNQRYEVRVCWVATVRLPHIASRLLPDIEPKLTGRSNRRSSGWTSSLSPKRSNRH